MWARVSGPENKGDIGLQPCHGSEGRESKDGRTVTAVSTRCSSTSQPIFFLLVLLLSTGQAEVASVASNSVREFQVKVREVPEGARESLGEFGCSRNDLPLKAWRLESDNEENSNHRHH